MARNLGLLIWLWGAAAAADGEPRECATNLQPNLRNELARAYPKAHVPTLKELDAASVAANLRDDGDGCFAVTQGDYNGDGYIDRALIMATGSVPQLVLALGSADVWETRSLPTFCTAVATCYVDTQRAGLYQRADSLSETPLRVGERSNLQASHPVVVSGNLQSTAFAYTHVPGGWAFVQVLAH